MVFFIGFYFIFGGLTGPFWVVEFTVSEQIGCEIGKTGEAVKLGIH